MRPILLLLGLLFATSCQNISANTLPGVGEITSLEFSEVEIIDANLLLPPTLTSISFEYCWSKDWDKIGSRLANLTNLTKLVASGCELTESFCKVISKSRSLKELKLPSNNIGGLGAKAIAGGLKKLILLDVFHNNVGEFGAKAIAEGLRQLKTLNISTSVEDVGWNGIGDSGAKALGRQLRQLTTLRAGFNTIGGIGAKGISGLKQLTTLYLGSNIIGDPGAKAISQMKQMKTLNLSDNSIGDEGVAAFSENMVNLVSLTLCQNKLTTIFKNALTQMIKKRNPNATVVV